MKEIKAPPIANGRTAEIYSWKEGEVLKLFYDWVKLEDIKNEVRIVRTIHACGLPIPTVGDLIHVNGRTGLIYQREYGDNMWKNLSQKPWRVFDYAGRMAKLHFQIHTRTIQGEIPFQEQKLFAKIRDAESIPSRLKSKALSALETMPNNNQLCHGDLHPGNILMTADGEVIIDWIDSSIGNPLADLARTTILILGAMETPQIKGSL